MGYRFRGFFTTSNPYYVGEAAVRRWPVCSWRPITEPFEGIGVRCPDPEKCGSDEGQYKALVDLGYRVEDELTEFTRHFPDLTFAFVEAECFGEICDYAGYVVRDGVVLLRVDFNDAGTEALKQLLEPLGVMLNSGYFEPFVRGFWGEC